MLFLDTSVVVALYVPESASGRAQRLLGGREPVAICPLTEVEFASAISRLYRMKAVNRADAARILDEFNEHVARQLYTFCPVTQEVFAEARAWIASLETPLRTLDAIQLAAAHVHGAALVTADKALVKAGRQLGVKVKAL